MRPTVLALALMAATAPAQRSRMGHGLGTRFSTSSSTDSIAVTSSSRGFAADLSINFWASWCAPCRAEMPDLISAWRQHSGHGLQVLAVNLTDQERRKDVTRFVAELGMPFPVLLDTRGKVRELYALISLPTTVFVDSTGIVRSVHAGPPTRNALALGLGALLPGPPQSLLSAVHHPRTG